MKAYQIKIELVNSNPLIWRRVIVPVDITFRRLHDVIQFAMGWMDYHLYEFEFPNEKLRITNDEEAYEEYKYYKKVYKGKKLTKEDDPYGFIEKTLEITIRKPQSIKIDKYLQEYKVISYVYDFGDNWEHKIILEKVIDDYEFGYPTCIEGEYPCPPEDVGGISGYEEFLEVINDPNHEDFEGFISWAKEQGYKENWDIKWTNIMMKHCLKLKKVKKEEK